MTVHPSALRAAGGHGKEPERLAPEARAAAALRLGGMMVCSATCKRLSNPSAPAGGRPGVSLDERKAYPGICKMGHYSTTAGLIRRLLAASARSRRAYPAAIGRRPDWSCRRGGRKGILKYWTRHEESSDYGMHGPGRLLPDRAAARV